MLDNDADAHVLDTVDSIDGERFGSRDASEQLCMLAHWVRDLGSVVGFDRDNYFFDHGRCSD